MNRNIGTKDRLARLAVAVVLLGLSLWLHSWILFGCALFVFFEVFASWCLFYQLIGKNTCPIKKNRK